MRWRDFDIEIYRLSNKQHQYEFQITEEFFSLFETSMISVGQADVFIDLNKTETFIDMKFKIVGKYELICDRSLRKFDYQFTAQEKILFKYGDEEKEVSEELYYITNNTQKVNVAQFIYEFISMTMPMKSIHPDLEKDFTNEPEEGELVYSTSTNDEDWQAEETEDDEIDPRWNVLKDLNKKN
jgi:uncharacterized metal-binding protein YceD (DUF177 family)